MTEGRYSGNVRVRSAGLIVRENRLLLVKLKPPTRPHSIWMPPGGEIQPGESIQEALKREVFEETGLETEVLRKSLVHEFIEPPWHAIEFYLLCRAKEGRPSLGKDPELNSGDQILQELAFIPFEELVGLELYPLILKDRLKELVNPKGELIIARSGSERSGSQEWPGHPNVPETD